jgi:hypothetical protein
VTPTKICLGEVNEITESGITTTSAHLVEKYRKAFGAEIVEEDPRRCLHSSLNEGEEHEENTKRFKAIHS